MGNATTEPGVAKEPMMGQFLNHTPCTAAAKPALTFRCVACVLSEVWSQLRQYRRFVTTKSCVLALVLCGSNAMAGGLPGILLRAITTEATHKATPPARSSATQPSRAAADAPQISYVDGQLTIRALNLTVGEVLTKVSSLTGMKLDVPPAASRERMPFVDLGPGPAREVLATLLGGSSFDYLIQSSDTDPDNIQSVILMSRDAKGSNAPDTVRPPRGPYARGAAAQPVAMEESPAPPDSSAGTQPDIAPPTEAPSPASPAVPEPPPSQPAPSLATPPGQGLFNQPRPGGAQNVPADLSPQSINQQLQQMYQQRIQINQQERQAVTPPRNN